MGMFNDIVTSIPLRFRKEKAVDYETVFHFDIVGDEGYPFSVIIRKGSCELKEGLSGNANCVVKAKTENYIDLELGKTNPQIALITGKVKVSNLAEMMRFAKLFNRYLAIASEKSLQAHISARKPLDGPLQGIKVIDLTRLLPGPMATMLMADMGAEVIKVEDPSNPDYIRSFPPFIDGQSAFYLAVNRSKRSMAINYQVEEGKKILLDLIKTADIFIEQFRPGVMANLGLSYEQLKAINPKLIYVSITGYGQQGPYAQYAGHDLNYISYSGLLGITGNDNGPVIPGGQIADIAGGGYMAVNACLAALLSRQSTGNGQWVDVSMTDCMVPLITLSLAEQNIYKQPLRGKMPLSGQLANYNVYRCADGKFVSLGALEPKFWEAFCDIANQPDWKMRIMDQGDQQHELVMKVTKLFLTQTQEQWLALADGKEVCLSPVLDMDELATNEQLMHRNMVVHQQTNNGLDYQAVGIPLKFGGTPAKTAWLPPALGEDTISILKELGYTEARIINLSQNGHIGI